MFTTNSTNHFKRRKCERNVRKRFLRIIDIHSNILQLDEITENMEATEVTEIIHLRKPLRMKIVRVFNSEFYFLRGIRFNIVRSEPKISSKPSCESRQSNEPV